MTGVGIGITLLVCLATLLAPRRLAAVPLLITTLYVTYGPKLDLGAASFNALRFVILAGFLRTFLRRERLAGGGTLTDVLFAAWAVVVIASSFFHAGVGSALVYRFGVVMTMCGVYFLLRVWIADRQDAVRVGVWVLILLLPVSLEMLREKLTGTNLFALLGGVPESVAVRNGRLRAQGPFGHAILAGTVGALAIPIGMYFWRHRRWVAAGGLFAAGVMVFASSSSGPILSSGAALFGLMLWPVRDRMRWLVAGAAAGVLMLQVVMNRPFYFVLADIDLTGGSTGWHRAALIQASIDHLGDWWIAGTDYTRDWMPTGVSWSAEHTDLTNHYIATGVMAGLPAVMLFTVILIWSFVLAGRLCRRYAKWPEGEGRDAEWFVWVQASITFGHVVTMISVSYFDQTILFLLLPVAALTSMTAVAEPVDIVDDAPSPASDEIGAGESWDAWDWPSAGELSPEWDRES